MESTDQANIKKSGAAGNSDAGVDAKLAFFFLIGPYQYPNVCLLDIINTLYSTLKQAEHANPLNFPNMLAMPPETQTIALSGTF